MGESCPSVWQSYRHRAKTLIKGHQLGFTGNSGEGTVFHNQTLLFTGKDPVTPRRKVDFIFPLTTEETDSWRGDVWVQTWRVRRIKFRETESINITDGGSDRHGDVSPDRTKNRGTNVLTLHQRKSSSVPSSNYRDLRTNQRSKHHQLLQCSRKDSKSMTFYHK